jgi:ferric-dicitrate binding protein FerR (iron transport regulator)
VVAELVRSAGRLSAPPADELARIKSAVHAAWRGKTGRRPRRSGVPLFAVAAAVAALAIGLWLWQWGPSEPVAPTPSGVVQAIVGDVSLETEGAAISAVRGASVPAGTIVTTAAGSRAALRMPTGHSVRIDAGSRVRVLEAATVDLVSGGVYVDSRGNVSGEPLVVETRLGEIRELGTQFEARLDDASLRVRVREGSVILDTGAGSLEVSSGAELELAEDGSVVRREAPRHGHDWTWVTDVAPMMEIEGRSLRQFLEWVARERGWILRFDSLATSAEADSIILDGSIDGLTLDQALEAVLATSRLTHRVDQGVLEIE